MKNISIVTGAYNINIETISRFINLNCDVLDDNTNIYMVTDTIKIERPYVKNIIYPIQLVKYSPSKICNYGIRSALSDNDIIIKTDIDIIFSKELIDYIRNIIVEGTGVSAICSNITIKQSNNINDIKWDDLELRKGGTGACLALHKNDWMKMNGYNEMMEGWGFEDDDILARCRDKINLISSAQYPLFHIQHNSDRSTLGNNKNYWTYNKENNVQIGKEINWSNIGENWGII